METGEGGASLEGTGYCRLAWEGCRLFLPHPFPVSSALLSSLRWGAVSAQTQEQWRQSRNRLEPLKQQAKQPLLPDMLSQKASNILTFSIFLFAVFLPHSLLSCSLMACSSRPKWIILSMAAWLPPHSWRLNWLESTSISKTNSHFIIFWKKNNMKKRYNFLM